MGSLDIRYILLDLHRMRLELERSLEVDESFLTRNGSIRGKKLHVFNTIRMIRNKEEWKRNYLQEDNNKVVVYITSCGILRKVWERCRDTVELLKALNIKAEYRDLNLYPTYVDELIDRMHLDQTDRELIFDSLPSVYVNGKYFGNDVTLIQENEKKQLVNLLHEYKGRSDCNECNGIGYKICSKCHGSKKGDETFRIRLRCANCDKNGIAPCTHCSPSI